jgi:hypothetical protein
MASYPRSCIYLAPLLEGSGFQGAPTFWTSARCLLRIRIYPTRIQVAWRDVTTQIYLGIFMDIWIRVRTRQACIHPARWGTIDLLFVLFSLLIQLYCIGICTAQIFLLLST